MRISDWSSDVCSSDLLLYIGPGKILGGSAPIVEQGIKTYSNPLPHVLILTAIVVGVATLALGLALVVRVNEAYGSIEEDELLSSEERRVGQECVSPGRFRWTTEP